MKNQTGATFFLVDEIALPDESKAATAPRELIEAAQKSGARRKFLARGEGGFHSQHSEFPAGFEVPPHSHDHDEMIVVVDGSLTMLGGGPTLGSGDSMVLGAGLEYGFAAGDDGVTFLTIRTGVAGTSMS